MPHSRIVKYTLRTGAVLAGATALIGVLHLPAARPLLGLLTGKSCPFGMESNASAAERERGWQKAVTPASDAPLARSRPAFVFDFKTSKKADVLAWASAHHTVCREEAKGLILRCENPQGDSIVPVPAGVTTLAVSFRIRPDDRLEAIQFNASTPSVDAAVQFGQAQVEVLTHATGEAATRSTGTWSGAFLSQGSLAQARTEFHLRDYVAKVVATNMGASGYYLSEELIALSPPS